MTKKLIVLDLDETLVYAAENEINGCNPDFYVGQYIVYKRPFLADFLDFCKEHFSVSVWTSSSNDYAAGVVAEIFEDGYPLEFVWSRERCTRKFDPYEYTNIWIKDFKKIKKKGYDIENIIMIDDTPAKLQRNYGNHVYIRPFEGDRSDIELQILMRYLLELKSMETIRSVEKRGWRNKYET